MSIDEVGTFKASDNDIPVLVFDVNETLLDIDALKSFFQSIFGQPNRMREWFAQLILYTQALSLSGRYAPFEALGGGVLRMLRRSMVSRFRMTTCAPSGTLYQHCHFIPMLRLRLTNLVARAFAWLPSPTRREGEAAIPWPTRGSPTTSSIASLWRRSAALSLRLQPISR